MFLGFPRVIDDRHAYGKAKGLVWVLYRELRWLWLLVAFSIIDCEGPIYCSIFKSHKLRFYLYDVGVQ